MNLPKLAIRRPVATVVIMLLFVLLGVVSFGSVPLDLLPNINVPVVVVMTQYEGAGPQEIEQLVSMPLEEAMATVTGIRSVESQSSEGNSVVMAEFDWGTDMDFAALEVREKVDRVKGFLPEDSADPMILKIDPSMMMGALQLSVSGGSDMGELKLLVEESIVPKLERLEGVAAVDVLGGREREIHVNLDVDKLRANSLSVLQVQQALAMGNLNLPAGSIGQAGSDYVVRVLGEYDSLADIRNVMIETPMGGQVRLGTLAEVEDGLEDPSTIARLDSEPTLGLSVQKESDANTVGVVTSTLERMKQLQEELPGELTLGVASNPAEYIQQSLTNVSQSAILGGLLAVVILYLFLANIRTTAIIAASIPISVIVTISLLYFFDLTLNMMTLGGLALGVGMLVDNAIVVLESIYRHREEGEESEKAAAVGAQEVAMAITASTLTSMAVFLPIAFVEGLAAEIFRQLAFTVTFSLLASLAVALTLIPMLSARLLRGSGGEVSSELVEAADEEEGLTSSNRTWFQRLFRSIENFYEGVLDWSLRHRAVVVIIGVAALGVAVALVPMVGTEFLPAMDTGEFIVQVEMPRGSSLSSTDEVTADVENVVLKVPELESVFTTVGSSSFTTFGGSGNSPDRAVVFGQLVGRDERERSTDAIVESLRQKLSEIPGARINVVNAATQTMGGNMMGEAPVMVRITGDNLDTLRELADRLAEKMHNVKGLREIESSVEEGRPEYRVKIKRDAAAHYGLNTAQVAQTVRTVVEGSTATRYRAGADSIDVVVRGQREDRKDLDQLENLLLLTPKGARVSLSSVADLGIARGPVTIERSGQVRYVQVTADMVGRSLGDVVEDIQAEADEMHMPMGYNLEFTGEFEQMTQSFEDLTTAFLMAAVLVYGILAVQFESFYHPLTIMLSIPLAIVGVVGGLLITGRTLNVSGFIGIIMLAGIVVNNAIVLIDYVNQLRRRGQERSQAVRTAGRIRLRPILMTAMTTVLAMLPMAFAVREGTEMEAPLATVIVFGLSFATLLTLIFIPVMYTLLEDLASTLSSWVTPAETTVEEAGSGD